MRGVFIILDGAADLPNKQLGDKTPFEAAKTPNIDFFAARGELGYMFPVKPGFIPESDESIVSIFGNNLDSSSRGQLEVAGAGINVVRGDLAFRVNFATIDPESREIIDRRVGRTLTTSEARELENSLNKKIKLPFDFSFKSTVQHRGALVFRGGFSDLISGNDFSYSEKGNSYSISRTKECSPLDDDENSQYTANVVNEFLVQAEEILVSHPVNLNRIKKGLLPANYILLRSPGAEKPKLKQYKNWFSLAYMPLEIGFSQLSGMRTLSFEYPKLKGLDSYENLHKGLKSACKVIVKTIKKYHKKYDYAYFHIKETDLPGHDNKPFEKKEMIEYIDSTVFKFLRKFAPARGIKIVLTSDHSTPCKLKAHSADPVPVLYYSGEEVIPRERKFCEKEARIGSLGSVLGKDLFEKVGFVS